LIPKGTKLKEIKIQINRSISNRKSDLPYQKRIKQIRMIPKGGKKKERKSPDFRTTISNTFLVLATKKTIVKTSVFDMWKKLSAFYIYMCVCVYIYIHPWFLSYNYPTMLT
jgi:hypothetical protein